MKLIGLDFETSGTDPWGSAAPIQIGIAHDNLDYPDAKYGYMVKKVGGWDFTNEYEWSEVSESIHGITREELDRAEPAWKVDVRLASLLLDHVGSRMWNIAVGWNVAGFDRQFITRHFPNLNRILSYRTIDLNALVFDQAIRLNPKNPEGPYKGIKREVKEYAAEQIGGDNNWHDAGYDALASLHALDYLQGRDESSELSSPKGTA